jgi:hypothetical protein
MSLDKAINSGKEKRKKYRGCKAIDTSCRNNGTCPWCQGQVKYKIKKAQQRVETYDEREVE